MTSYSTSRLGQHEMSGLYVKSAIHEAGHAVAAMHFGLYVSRAQIGQKNFCLIQTSQAVSNPSARQRQRMFTDVVVLAAGQAAVDVILEGPCFFSDSSDQFEIHKIARVLHGDDDKKAKRWISQAFSRALRLASLYDAEIINIAHYLNERKKLEYNQISQAFFRSRIEIEKQFQYKVCQSNDKKSLPWPPRSTKGAYLSTAFAQLLAKRRA